MSEIATVSVVPVSRRPEGLSPYASVGRVRPVPGGGGRRRSPRRWRSTVSRELGEIVAGRMPAGSQLKHHRGGGGASEGGWQGGVGGQIGRRQGDAQRPPYPARVGGGKTLSVHPSQHQACSFDSPRPRLDRAARKGPLPTDSAHDPTLLSLKPAALFTVNQYRWTAPYYRELDGRIRALCQLDAKFPPSLYVKNSPPLVEPAHLENRQFAGTVG